MAKYVALLALASLASAGHQPPVVTDKPHPSPYPCYDCKETHPKPYPTSHPNKTDIYAYNSVDIDIYVSAYAIYCDVESTTVVEKGHTYSATKGETLIITDCPCTVTSSAYVTPSVPYTKTTYSIESKVESTYTTVCPTPTTYTYTESQVEKKITATENQVVTLPTEAYTSRTAVAHTSVITPGPSPAPTYDITRASSPVSPIASQFYGTATQFKVGAAVAVIAGLAALYQRI